jgi:hypothetical protein
LYIDADPSFPFGDIASFDTRKAETVDAGGISIGYKGLLHFHGDSGRSYAVDFSARTIDLRKEFQLRA